MLKYIRNFFVAFLFSGVFSLTLLSQAHAAQIDINSADAATLAESVNGIGPSKAQAIIDYREENGPFASLDDLVKVQGIGFKTLDRIREFVTVTPTRTQAKPSSVTDSVVNSPDTKQPVLLPN